MSMSRGRRERDEGEEGKQSKERDYSMMTG
jgi:hypothetical protein